MSEPNYTCRAIGNRQHLTMATAYQLDGYLTPILFKLIVLH
jgi:hypothetical protein